MCGNSNKTLTDGHCAGNRCCELEIPKGLKYLEIVVRSFHQHNEVFDFNPCGYAFVIQQNNFTLSSKYIHMFTHVRVPLMLDWGIPNGTCSKSNKKTNCHNICGPNTQKINYLNDESQYRSISLLRLSRCK